MRVPELSTPWVAGSNPAGITPQTQEKSPINKGIFYVFEKIRSTECLEREGIRADKKAPQGHQIPAQIPALVPLCEIVLAPPAMSPGKTLLLFAAALGFILVAAQLAPLWQQRDAAMAAARAAPGCSGSPTLAWAIGLL
jgi:hypothetical protein